jgi:hypothetical protein
VKFILEGMMKALYVVCPFLLLMLITACGGGSDATNPENRKFAGNFIGEQASEEDVSFIKGFETSLLAFEDNILALEQSAAIADDAIKGSLFLRIGELRSQLGQFKTRLYEYGHGNSGGDTGRADIEQAWQNLELSYQDALQQFDLGDQPDA